MPIPDYQEIMLPFLKLCQDGQEHSIREAYQKIPDFFGLSEEQKKEPLPSGQQSIINNRIGWARTYLKKSRLIESPKRGRFRITQRGLDVLKSPPRTIDNNFLMQFPEFAEFKTAKSREAKQLANEGMQEKNPDELLEYAFEELNRDLAIDLLEALKSCSPSFFEQLVIDLLLAMGYGGSRKDAGQAIGKTGDEGIDGIINEDKLGLDVIYVQAKRWDTTVSRPEIQKFAGALQGKRARKGIFITASSFSKEAENYASMIDNKIILIDGMKLTKHMIEHNVGVTPVTTYAVKKIDLDYFE